MCWYIGGCLVACVCRCVVSVVSYMVSSSVGMLSCFGSRLGSLRDVVQCTFSEVVVYRCSELLAVKEYVGVRQ